MVNNLEQDLNYHKHRIREKIARMTRLASECNFFK